MTCAEPKAGPKPPVAFARAIEELPEGDTRAVAIGNFDGVHRGHRAVIEGISGLGMTSTIVTFDPHPRSVFGEPVPALCSFERRLELLAATGVDEILVLPFTTEMAALPPEVWVDRYLRPIGTSVVSVGEDFRFGKGRAGDVGLLRSLGIDVQPVGLLDEVSSSRIRDLVGAGRLGLAADMLGRPHELDLEVAEVKSEGSAGFLLGLEDRARRLSAPPPGDYFGSIEAGPTCDPCITTVKERGGGGTRLETRVRRFGGELGRRLRVSLHALAAGG
jgi:riboflavin kinase/FMN adenylyltransferase